MFGRQPPGLSRPPPRSGEPYDLRVGADEADVRYDRWVGWFERISNETYTLFAYRDYWRGLAEMTEANGQIPPTTFFDALGVWYAATQGTNVRRQLDRDRRAVSLRNLLGDIKAHPDVITRDRYVGGIWEIREGPLANRERGLANANYDRFAGVGNDAIDPDRTQQDIDLLRAVGEPIARYVNEAIAHAQERATAAVPTYADLNSAIDQIGDLLKKYGSLLHAAILATLTHCSSGGLESRVPRALAPR